VGCNGQKQAQAVDIDLNLSSMYFFVSSKNLPDSSWSSIKHFFQKTTPKHGNVTFFGNVSSWTENRSNPEKLSEPSDVQNSEPCAGKQPNGFHNSL